MKSINIIVVALAIVVGFTSISSAESSKVSRFNRFPADEVQEGMETIKYVMMKKDSVENIQILKKGFIGKEEYKKYVGRKASKAGNRYASRVNRLLYSNFTDNSRDVEMMVVVYTADLIYNGKITPVIAITVFYSVLDTGIAKTQLFVDYIETQEQYNQTKNEYFKNLKILVNG